MTDRSEWNGGSQPNTESPRCNFACANKRRPWDPGPGDTVAAFKVSTASLASGNIPPGRRCDAIANTAKHRSVRESGDLLPPSARRTPVWSATSGPTGLRVILLQQPAGRFVVCSGSGPGLRKGCSRNQKSQRQISLHLGGGGSPYEGQQLLVRGIHSPGLLPRVFQGPSKLVQASNRRTIANGGAPSMDPKVGAKRGRRARRRETGREGRERGMAFISMYHGLLASSLLEVRAVPRTAKGPGRHLDPGMALPPGWFMRVIVG